MEYEKCVVCGTNTEILKDTPVQNREGYVSGGGQLCRDCYYNLYLNSSYENDLKPAESEMKKLLEISSKE